FTNRGNAAGLSGSYERDFSGGDRLRITVTRNVVRFLVPNELIQQTAGQRQDIADTETSGQIYFQHPISQDLFLTFSGRLRDANATLRSHPPPLPVLGS